MDKLVNEQAMIVSNEPVGPRLHLLVLEAPDIASRIKPGQFVHVKLPANEHHVLRRPFSVYARDAKAGIIEILYQEVGALTSFMPKLGNENLEVIGPIGNTWSAPALFEEGKTSRALLVGGGVGAAPLYMLAERLDEIGMGFDIVLGAQTRGALATAGRYSALTSCEPICSTDDGSYGYSGFCTPLVEERLKNGATSDSKPYDYLAVCGPEPLMRIVSSMAIENGLYCEVSMEKRMACGIGACLSCVVDTVGGKKRSCVDGPIFDASEVIWR